jgi:hypothetical protein
MVAQTAQQAIDNANSYGSCEPAMCLKYVRTWLEIGSRESTAYDAWTTARHKHPGDKNPPDGAPAFWRSSASGSGAGHIALVRKSDMRTTDKATSGDVNNDDGTWPREQWGQSYLGWTEDVNGVDIPYLRAADDWRASGDVYVEKLHRGQQDSDSVARLRYRLENHAHIPDDKQPGYGGGYGEKVQDAVRYWLRNIDPQHGKGGPTDGSELTNPQANRLFGPNYNVIED